MSSSVQGPRTLWLPLARPAWAWLAALASGLLYAATATRDMGFYDSPELLLAARTLGLGHPPGQPLHTLLGALLSPLPLGPVPYRVALLSCLSGAGCVLAAISLLDTALARAEQSVPARSYALALFSVVALSQHNALWEQSTRVEVYALSAALALWVIARLAAALPDEVDVRVGLVCGAVLGLSACANPVLSALAALAVAPAWLNAWRRRRLGGAQTLAALGGGGLGLLPYAYLPLAARHADAFVWARPDNAVALWRFVSAADYAPNLWTPVAQWLQQIADWLAHSTAYGTLPLWLVGLAGLGWLGAGGLGRSFAALAWLASTLYLTRNVVWHPDVPDYASYASVAGFVCVSGWGVLVAALGAQQMRAGAATAALGAVALTILAPPGAFSRTRHSDQSASVLSQTLLDHLPPRAVVIVESDHWAGPLLYAQAGQGRRDDVVVVIAGLASSSWYWAELYRAHPELSPFALQGAGGREGRLRRFLDAHPAREMFVEHSELAARLALAVCPDLWVLRVAETCSEQPALAARASQLLLDLARSVGEGEPTSRQVLGAVALRYGDALWRSGQSSAAASAYLAVHPALAARLPTQPAPPLRGREVGWLRDAAIGDPARTLFMASRLAFAAGDSALAARWLAEAAADGLPEATVLVR